VRQELLARPLPFGPFFDTHVFPFIYIADLVLIPSKTASPDIKRNPLWF